MMDLDKQKLIWSHPFSTTNHDFVAEASFGLNESFVLIRSRAGRDDEVSLLNAETGETVQDIYVPGRVIGARFSPDGTKFFTTEEGGTVRIWTAGAQAAAR